MSRKGDGRGGRGGGGGQLLSVLGSREECLPTLTHLRRSPRRLKYLQAMCAVFAIFLISTIEYYVISTSIMSKRLNNAFEAHLLLVSLLNIALRLKAKYMVPINVIVVIIYIGSLMCTFLLLSKDIDDAKLPSDIIGFLIITVTTCIVTTQSNYSREAFLRKDFVLEQKLK